MQFFILTLFYMIFSCVSLKTTPKFCINCKFAINDMAIDKYNNNKYMKCSLFPLNVNDLFDKSLFDESKFLVTGINSNSNSNSNSILSEKDYMYCSTARQFDHMCGKEGLKYKKKYVRKQNP
jgi:hypothetical protein